MTNANIAAIFSNTNIAYLESCLKQRNPGPSAAGSVFAQTQTVDSLATAEWEVYEHPAVQLPAVAYKASVGGNVGLITIDNLAPETPLTLDDRKGTGYLEVVHTDEMGPAVNFTTLLVGPDREDPEKTVVWTFFPGDPIGPSRLETNKSGHAHGDKITAAQALELGFEYAKVEQG